MLLLETFRMQSNAAIVTTLRNAGAVLDSFVAYHRAIGFEHLFLFFDDPADPDFVRAGAMQGVTAIAHDARLRGIWRSLPGYRRHGASVDSEVMSRQLLNVEYAMGLARERACGWLLNIDVDELFFAPNESVGEHFAALAATPFETVSYLNYEAVPERDAIGDFFRDVNLFKLPCAAVEQQLAGPLAQAQQVTPQLKPFFHFYANGKSAVRLTPQPAQPVSVHAFRHEVGATRAVTSARHFVLHYACCGFETFWTKYRTLGNFADRWWGQYDITASIGTFHLDARDVVMRGNREEALAFYRERLAITDSARAERLIREGLLTRFDQPRTIIAQALTQRDKREAPAVRMP
jgi:Glycosyl transferase family 2